MTPSLETERLILKPLTHDFCNEQYLGWLNDSDVVSYLERQDGYTMEMLRDFITQTNQENIFFWAIIIKASLTHIGNIKIDKIDFGSCSAEYGIMIGEKSTWGHGYAAEASRAVIDFCFNRLAINAINLGVLARNINGVNLYKKLGFTIVSTENISDRSTSLPDLSYRMVLKKFT